MCTELSHRCKYCNKDYLCKIQDNICATMNFDDDRNLCPSCRNKLEILIADNPDNKTIWKLLLKKMNGL